MFTFGDAKFYGSTGAMHLNRPITGMARTATGRGYWLVATDGGMFTFGDARLLRLDRRATVGGADHRAHADLEPARLLDRRAERRRLSVR